jgi:hypothetical protein
VPALYSWQAFQQGVGGLAPPAGAFSTTFSLTENPISEGGIWLNGLADGLDWNNVQTTNTGDGIHRVCASSLVSGFNDPTAIINPTFRAFANNQFVQGTIYRAAGYFTSVNFHETELRMRSTMSAHSCTGYELLIAIGLSTDTTSGWALVKWNGALGDFTTISNNPASIPPAADGDIWRVEMTGSVAKVFLNSVQQGSNIDLSVGSTIAVWPGGNPGVGMYPIDPGSVSTSYGWKSFSAGDL